MAQNLGYLKEELEKATEKMYPGFFEKNELKITKTAENSISVLRIKKKELQSVLVDIGISGRNLNQALGSLAHELAEVRLLSHSKFDLYDRFIFKILSKICCNEARVTYFYRLSGLYTGRIYRSAVKTDVHAMKLLNQAGYDETYVFESLQFVRTYLQKQYNQEKRIFKKINLLLYRNLARKRLRQVEKRLQK